jgi:hypothetical protein
MKKLHWMALDNAAKIFPAARNRNWSNVFRISATLTEEIDIPCLQEALEQVAKRCPSIAVCIKPGFFWYYIEQIPHTPEILAEKPYPLSRMPFDDIRKCAIRVLVYRNRVAVEFFHAVTDGNGGLIFVKTLIAEYLRRKYGVNIPYGNGILDPNEKPSKEEMADSFQLFAGPVKASRSGPDSFRILEKREPDGYRTNTTFIFDAADIHRRAKEQGVTVTAYFAAVLVMAALRIQEKTVKNPKRHQQIFITIPVNLRKMFPSRSLRNFMLYANPGIDPRLGEYSFEEICQLIHHQMKVMITPKNMAALIAKNVGDEKPLLLRATPLFLKNAVMKAVFNAVGERKACFSFSNLGIVDVPKEYARFVRRMDFVVGTQSQGPYNIGALTYGDKLYINLIRNVEPPILERELYVVLKELGIRPCAESNARPKGEPYVLY